MRVRRARHTHAPIEAVTTAHVGKRLHSRRLFVGLGPLDHVDMPAVDALKQEDRGESVVEPGQLPGELHARPATTDQPRLWLVVHAISQSRF